jgi:cephalosporin hydroxylase
MGEIERFRDEVQDNIRRLGADPDLRALSRVWMREAGRLKYSYNFTWMGRPTIQFPQDLMAMQEIIWRVRPRLIVETGIAHGGSLIFYASMLELLGNDGLVIGVDIDIREHKRRELEAHPLFKRIRLVQGSSIDPATVAEVHRLAGDRQPAIVTLDSNHTHAHVLGELEAYCDLVHEGSYLVVFDTIIEDLPAGWFTDRPWDKGNNAKTAVHEFLRNHPRFTIDRQMEDKLQITVAPDGFLRCTADP